MIELTYHLLRFVNMAAMNTFHRLFFLFNEFASEEEHIYQYIHRELNACGILANLQRDEVPKVKNYMTGVFQSMGIPQNIDDFRTHFRVSRNLFGAVLLDIQEWLILKGRGPHETVSPEKQLAVCLWYIANMESMREVAHMFGLSKSSVHGIVMRVCEALLKLGPRVIVWPSAHRQRQIAHEVQQVCRLPGVVGFIDGCHIRLASAIHGERDYYNRKGFPSMQLQAVVDHEMKFINVLTGWPGCVHDARVLRNSSLFAGAESGELVLQDHEILADSAYPLRNWLITPFKNFGNLSVQQVRFNKRVSMVRQTIERAFGHLKGRFRRLQCVPFHSSEETCTLIFASCILHNLCVSNADDVDEYIQELGLDQVSHPNQCQNVYQNGHNGLVRRMQLVNIL